VAYELLEKEPNYSEFGLYRAMGGMISEEEAFNILLLWRCDMDARKFLGSQGWMIDGPIRGGPRRSFDEVIADVVHTPKRQRRHMRSMITRALIKLRKQQMYHKPATIQQALEFALSSETAWHHHMVSQGIKAARSAQ